MPVDDGGGDEERDGSRGHVDLIITQVECVLPVCTPPHLQHIYCVCVVDKGSGAMSGTWTLLFKYSTSALIDI
jgi:hypothetical protein